MDATVARTSAGGITVVALRGELGVDTDHRLRVLMSALVGAATHRIVVDLSDLEFCDSIGLSAFVDAHRHCVASGGFLRLAAPSPFLLRVLAVVGLLGRLPVYDTVAAACAGDPAGRLSVPPVEYGRPVSGSRPHRQDR